MYLLYLFGASFSFFVLFVVVLFWLLCSLAARKFLVMTHYFGYLLFSLNYLCQLLQTDLSLLVAKLYLLSSHADLLCFQNSLFIQFTY